MCGITGFISKMGREEKKARLKPMMEIIAHRGPDDNYSYINDDIAMGFRRLAIIDVAGGRQPIGNEDRRIWITSNGEIYNFLTLRSDLIARGHAFLTHSDAEVALHAYEEWGHDCLQHLSGMFAFVIWDSKKKELFGAVDRLGIKPLYYVQGETCFIYASEIKAILASGLVDAEFDKNSLSYYAAFLWAPHPLTMFKGIKKLTPGHYFVRKVDADFLKITEYWDLNIQEDVTRKETYWTTRVRESLSQVVKSHLISEVPLGAFLSGGLDSSAICALMNYNGSKPITTYSIGFPRDDLKNDIIMDEMPYADRMASTLNSNHHKIIVSPDPHNMIQKYIWHMDEPVADPAAITTYLVSEAARKTLTVLLSGVGGDEVFAGYPRYLAMKYMYYYQLLPHFLRLCASKVISYLPGGKVRLLRDLKKFNKSSLLEKGDVYFDMLSYFNFSQQKMLFTDQFYESIRDIDVYYYHKKYFAKSGGLSWLNRLQYLDLKTFLPSLNLMYTDKMSMAASIEVRVPFLDHRFVEEMFRIPTPLKIRGTVQKYILKKSMEGILPEDIIWRKKAGFGAPIRAWIAGDLKEVVEDYLSPLRVKRQGIFNSDYISVILKKEFSDQESLSNHIWQLLVFQLWHETFIENKSNYKIRH